MFEYLEYYQYILVTGPQRSGTRICARMIAEDTGHRYVDEREIGIGSLYGLVDQMRKPPVVVQCPSLCWCIEQMGTDPDIAVVMMRRPVDEIIASQERIGWRYEIVELAKYKALKGPIAAVKYFFWDHYQMPKIRNPYEVEYESLSYHPLWVPKDLRTEFTSLQTQLEKETT